MTNTIFDTAPREHEEAQAQQFLKSVKSFQDSITAQVLLFGTNVPYQTIQQLDINRMKAEIEQVLGDYLYENIQRAKQVLGE